MNWNLEDHGDQREKRHWSSMRGLVPSYEEFWAKYVVPQTFRVMEESVLLLRPDAKWKSVANANYTLYTHLAKAADVLEDDAHLTGSDATYEFFSRLYSARCMIARLVSDCGKIMGEYGSAKRNDVGRWLSEGGSELGSRYKSLGKAIDDYRGEYVHAIELVRVNDLLPRRSKANKYADLSMMAIALGDATVQQSDFDSAELIARTLLDDACSVCNDLWRFLLEQFGDLPGQQQLLEDLGSATSRDEEVLRKLLESKAKRPPTERPLDLRIGYSGLSPRDPTAMSGGSI